MNFDDEDYVRLYTRDTVTWKLLGWQGRTVLLHMLRGKFDRAGIFVTDRHALSRAVTAATDLPLEVVEEGLRQVLAEGVWVESDGALVWPTFVEAQTAVRSDKARQRDTRRRRAAEKVADKRPADTVTNRDGSVTPSHEASQPVTLAEPSLAEPIRTDPPIAPQGAGDGPQQLTLAPVQPPEPDPVAEVFACWQSEMGHPRSKLDSARRRRIRARLADGLTQEDLCDAIRGGRRAPWLRGQNDRRATYDGIHTILRDAEQVEKLRDYFRNEAPPLPAAANQRGPTGLEDTEQW